VEEETWELSNHMVPMVETGDIAPRTGLEFVMGLGSEALAGDMTAAEVVAAWEQMVEELGVVNCRPLSSLKESSLSLGCLGGGAVIYSEAV
jgi:hypothetical protein